MIHRRQTSSLWVPRRQKILQSFTTLPSHPEAWPTFHSCWTHRQRWWMRRRSQGIVYPHILIWWTMMRMTAVISSLTQLSSIYVQQMLWKCKVHVSLCSGEEIYNCVLALEANCSSKKWRYNSFLLSSNPQKQLMSRAILLHPLMSIPSCVSFSTHYFWGFYN